MRTWDDAFLSNNETRNVLVDSTVTMYLTIRVQYWIIKPTTFEVSANCQTIEFLTHVVSTSRHASIYFQTDWLDSTDMSHQILHLLCSSMKLERDQAISDLNKTLPVSDEAATRAFKTSLIDAVAARDVSWETKYGCLLGAKIVSNYLDVDNELDLLFVNKYKDTAIRYLVDEEPRVRVAAGESETLLLRYLSFLRDSLPSPTQAKSLEHSQLKLDRFCIPRWKGPSLISCRARSILRTLISARSYVKSHPARWVDDAVILVRVSRLYSTIFSTEFERDERSSGQGWLLGARNDAQMFAKRCRKLRLRFSSIHRLRFTKFSVSEHQTSLSVRQRGRVLSMRLFGRQRRGWCHVWWVVLRIGTSFDDCVALNHRFKTFPMFQIARNVTTRLSIRTETSFPNIYHQACRTTGRKLDWQPA